MLSEIGSNFWIDPGESGQTDRKISISDFYLEGADSILLSSGRQAITKAIETAEIRNPGIQKNALVPSFTCETVIEPFLLAGYRIESFPIDRNLSIQGEEIIRLIKKKKIGILIFHHYFGFETISGKTDLLREIKGSKTQVIEDRTQCLYSQIEPAKADYVVGSMRKWHGIPDGAFVVCKEGKFLNRPETPDKELEKAKIAAGRAKYEYLFYHKGKKQDFLEKYEAAENILDHQKELFCISPFSYHMQASMDREKLKNRRRENYLTVLQGLKDVKKIKVMFPALPQDIVPLYFPIWTEDRTNLQKRLKENHIYAPVVWPKAGCLSTVCDAAEGFYRNLLCLPIDQRYGRDDMERMVKVIKKQEEGESMCTQNT